MSTEGTAALQKYERRGWDIVYAYNSDQLTSNHTPSECKVNIRRVGDSFCWVHRYSNGGGTLNENICWHLKYSLYDNADEGDTLGGNYFALAVIDE
jgi:hypothetical protein